jgi:2-hydroxy-6-oxonona-2,4-dienedioate hydrolase
MTAVSLTDVQSVYGGTLHFIDVAGVRTRYYVGGSGDDLLLIHGGHYGFSDSLDMWSLQLEALATRFRVYAPDRLGQGWTDNPRADRDYTFDAAFDHLVSWIEAVGIRRAHVVGHSRAGLFATWLALQRPELVQTLTIVDSRTLSPVDPRFPFNETYRAACKAACAATPTRATVRVEPEANSYSTAHVTDAFVDRLLEIYQLPKTEQAQRTMEATEEALFLPNIERRRDEALARIDAEGLSMPTLVVWGVNDPTAQFGLGLELFGRIAARTRDLALHAFNEAGHYSFREKPDEFNALIGSFCGSHRVGAALATDDQGGMHQ